MSERDAFVAERGGSWRELEGMLGRDRLDAAGWSDLSRRYRSICADLSRVESEVWGEDVRRYLDGLAGRAHNLLYGSRQGVKLQPVQLLARDIPQEVRRRWRVVLLAAALFWLPGLFLGIASWMDPMHAHVVMSPQDLASMEEMHSAPRKVRGADTDAGMVGFYLAHNGGIALRCFVTGALFGLGSVYYLVLNGMHLGAVFGYLSARGLGGNLLFWVSGHGPWELMGIVLAGAAGLLLGSALIDTRGLRRVDSLRRAGPRVLRVAAAAVWMILVAALIEGLWSPQPMSLPLRAGFSLVQVLLIAAWLGLGGRSHR